MGDVLQDEIILLQEVYPGEFQVSFNSDNSIISVLITPGIGFNNLSNKLMQLTLIIQCPPNYPLDSPSLVIENPHGLCDSDVQKILNLSNELIRERKGDPILFEIIDFFREFISSNIPAVDCPICLTGFRNETEVYCTPQFHYFHKECIGKYMYHRYRDHSDDVKELLQKNPHAKIPHLTIPCPVCRVEDLPFVDSLAHQSTSR